MLSRKLISLGKERAVLNCLYKTESVFLPRILQTCLNACLLRDQNAECPCPLQNVPFTQRPLPATHQELVKAKPCFGRLSRIQRRNSHLHGGHRVVFIVSTRTLLKTTKILSDICLPQSLDTCRSSWPNSRKLSLMGDHWSTRTPDLRGRKPSLTLNSSC